MRAACAVACCCIPLCWALRPRGNHSRASTVPRSLLSTGTERMATASSFTEEPHTVAAAPRDHMFSRGSALPTVRLNQTAPSRESSAE